MKKRNFLVGQLIIELIELEKKTFLILFIIISLL